MNDVNSMYRRADMDMLMSVIHGPKYYLSWQNLDGIRKIISEQAFDLRYEAPTGDKYSIEFSADQMEMLRKILDLYEQVLVSYKIG